jgi:hypothetical protein
MKKYIILLIIILNSSFGFSQLNEKNDITILKKLTLEEINYSLKSKTDKGTYLIGITCDFSVWGECTAFVFKSFAGSWELKDKLTFSNTNGEIEEFTSNENLIYFGSHSTGGSSGNGSYYFNAFSFEENKFYSLEYSWNDFKYSSYGFSNIETIANNIVLNHLEKKASESEYVYKPSTELTLEESWKIENKNIYEKIFEEKTEIVFTYDNSNYEFEHKVSENSKYKIYNEFKGNLYGYNKITEEYFIIWVPSWNYDTTQFVNLDNEDNSVFILDSTLGSNGGKIYINLDTKEIFAIYKKVGETIKFKKL